MDEDKPSQQQRNDELDEELAKQLQAEEENAEDASGEEESAEDEEGGIAQLNEEELKMFEQVSKENMRTFLAEAMAYKKAGNYNKALQILKVILTKGEVIFGDPMHYELAVYYYSMGMIGFSTRRFPLGRARERRREGGTGTEPRRDVGEEARRHPGRSDRP